MTTYKVLIADDHEHAREAIRDILSASSSCEIIGEAVNGIEAVNLAEQLHPDLILMDIHMPECNGLQATRTIKQKLPESKIIILTVSEDSTHLFEALKEGAQGYLLKNTRPNEWDAYIEAVLDGRRISKAFIDDTLSKLMGSEPKEKPPLSSREIEVMKLAASGATNKEISSQLHITENTVKNHLKSVLRKLNIKNRVELARVAYESKWL
ncbi:response regulator transcription factor [Halobacillus salinarum]|uniref:Response regulator transcription factor n=1 Tax=Halobacillus salinarum TaxID=2932257 RepID=A0ABY4EH67_9BACI|nr:response regulator transcription factor [Halobacillus salinarum]UOQ43806.1 response regulator transcription factor [Halobacillus salinarum]